LKLSYVLPAVYAAVVLLAWIDFSRLPPDGLANVGLMLVVLPITLLDLALRSNDRPGSSVLMPDSFGYYGDHAVYFGTSVLIISAALWWLGSWTDQRIARKRGGGT
jgi:hypothetical protein